MTCTAFDSQKDSADPDELVRNPQKVPMAHTHFMLFRSQILSFWLWLFQDIWQGGGFRGTILVQEQYDLPKMESFYNNNGIAATYVVCPEGLRGKRACTVEMDFVTSWQVSFFLSDPFHSYTGLTSIWTPQQRIPSQTCGSELSLKHMWILWF